MPEIVVTLGGNEIARYTLDKDEISIGRAEVNDVRVNNLSVSRKHALIRREKDRYYLVDLESANGSFVNGTRVARSEIFNNDQIGIGKHILHFLVSELVKTTDYSSIERTIVLDKAARGPVLRVHSTNHRDTRLPLSGKLTRIGRAKDNDLRLVDWFVDMHQAVIEKEGVLYRLRDVSPHRGTMLNDQPVEESYLNEGDIIQAGISRMVFSLQAAGADVSPQPEAAAPPLQPAGPPLPVRVSMEPPVEELRVFTGWEEAPEKVKAPEPPLEYETAEAPPEPGASQPPPELEAMQEPLLPEDLAAVALPEFEPLEADLLEEPVFRAAEAIEPGAGIGGFTGELEEDLLDVEVFKTEEETLAPKQKAHAPASGMANLGDMAARVPKEDLEPAEPEEPAGPEEAAEPEEAEEPEEAAAPAEPGLSEADRKAVAMWEKALQNKSLFVRKQAAAQLKKLTGRDYAI